MTQLDSPCIPYPGSKDKDGYGLKTIRIGSHAKKTFHAHRLVYMICYGWIPSDVVVRHRCDNPPCVNPLHLTTGTQTQNIADKVSKDRQAKGEKVWTAKLTAEQVLAIRADPRGKTRLAPIYGVSESLIGQIKARKIWRHI